MLNKYSGSFPTNIRIFMHSLGFRRAVHNYSLCFVRQLSFYASLLIRQQLLSYLLSIFSTTVVN